VKTFKTTMFGVPLGEVARAIGRSYDWTRRNAESLGFTLRTRAGGMRRCGRRLYVQPNELRAFLAGGVDGLRSHKRGRRAAAAR
jgi:hypothetical protein